MTNIEITFEARQKLISEYTGSCIPELVALCDNIIKDIKNTLPNSCIIDARISEDNTILSVDVVSVENEVSENE